MCRCLLLKRLSGKNTTSLLIFRLLLVFRSNWKNFTNMHLSLIQPLWDGWKNKYLLNFHTVVKRYLKCYTAVLKILATPKLENGIKFLIVSIWTYPQSVAQVGICHVLVKELAKIEINLLEPTEKISICTNFTIWRIRRSVKVFVDLWASTGNSVLFTSDLSSTCSSTKVVTTRNSWK